MHLPACLGSCCHYEGNAYGQRTDFSNTDDNKSARTWLVLVKTKAKRISTPAYALVENRTHKVDEDLWVSEGTTT